MYKNRTKKTNYRQQIELIARINLVQLGLGSKMLVVDIAHHRPLMNGYS